MAAEIPFRRRLATSASWPFGVTWTAFHYIWRILPVYRTEEAGSVESDLPPALPAGVSHQEVMRVGDGAGPLLHRRYRCTVRDPRLTAEELIEQVARDPNQLTPRWIAKFSKAAGEPAEMRVGDEFLVHMPGPWNGPVRVVETRPDGFRFATLAGHLEAGQIEWRASAADGGLRFEIESWARGGDRLSAFAHDRLRMAKEVQLYMWTTVLERVPKLAGGRLDDGVTVLTRRVAPEAFTDASGGRGR